MESGSDRESASQRRPRGWLGWVVPVLLVCLVGSGVGVIALMPKQEQEPPPRELPPVNVTVLRVEAQPELADTFTLTAVVEPERVVRVAAEVPGRIEAPGRRQREVACLGQVFSAGTEVREGEQISVGDHLFELNKDLIQARYNRTQVQAEYDEREYVRILGLHERGATSKTELADAGTRRDVSKAALEEVARELERTTIVSPIDGILNRLPVEVGEYVSPGDPVAEIVNIDEVKVVVDVPERDVHYLKVGQTVDVLLRNPVETTTAGKITYISELADAGTRTTRLEIMVDNRDHALRSGQIVRARLTRRVLEDVIMIPLGAVIPLENGKVVYLVRDGCAERREIELGFIKGRSVRVLRGLEDGEQLIIVGQRYVGPGHPVAVVEEQ